MLMLGSFLPNEQRAFTPRTTSPLAREPSEGRKSATQPSPPGEGWVRQETVQANSYRQQRERAGGESVSSPPTSRELGMSGERFR